MPEKVHVVCDACGKRFQASIESLGKKARCSCGNTITLTRTPSGEELARKWYYAKDGQRYGPLPFSELRKVVESGQVGPEDFVWTRGMPTWRSVTEIEELAPAPAPQEPAEPTAGAQPAERPEAALDAAHEEVAPAPEAEQPTSAPAGTEAEHKSVLPRSSPRRTEEPAEAPSQAQAVPADEGEPSASQRGQVAPAPPLAPEAAAAEHGRWFEFLTLSLRILSYAMPLCMLALGVGRPLLTLLYAKALTLGRAEAAGATRMTEVLGMRTGEFVGAVLWTLIQAFALFIGFQWACVILRSLAGVTRRQNSMEERIARLETKR